MSTILLVGADQSLLRTRAALLRKTGCQTVCATANSALTMQGEYRCEIVVLCHTLPDAVGLALLRILRERWLQTRILQVLPHREWGTVSAAALADAVCYTEPERLILRTTELLRRRPHFQRTDDAASISAYLN